MKTVAALALLAATVASAADVTVLGAQQAPMPAAIDVRVASRDVLKRATALLNKNDAATDNNVMITRSNVLKTQNDRLDLIGKVMEALVTAADADSATSAVLTKNVLRAVSAPSDDAALMTKASAVVASKDDPSALARTISSFVDSAMAKEQSIQSKSQDVILARIGTSDILRQPTGAVNKNVAASGNQITIARSNVAPTQNDQVVLRGAKVADAVAPASAIDIGKIQDEPEESAGDHDEELEKKKKKKKTSSGKKPSE